MTFKRYILILLLLISISLVGCTDSTPQEKLQDSKDEDKKEQEVISIEKESEEENTEVENPYQEILNQLEAPKVPEAFKAIINYPSGVFAEDEILSASHLTEEMKRALHELPDLSDIDNQEVHEAFYAKLVSLFAQKYPNFDSIAADWEADLFGMPEMEDPRYQFKDKFNIEIILDVSGSMKKKIGGKTKLDLAKEAIKQFTSSLPEGANVSLRVYGHVDGGKDNSCKTVERVYGMKPYSPSEFNAALDPLQAVGWTPLAKALEEAQKDLATLDGESNTNFIYFVSDGIETCGGDPVKAAKEIAESKIQPIMHIIGFDVPTDEQQQLMDMAEAAKGYYISARNQQELVEELNRVKRMAEVWDKWKNDALQDIENLKRGRWYELIQYTNDMTSSAVGEDLSITAAAEYLYREGRINNYTRGYVYTITDERKGFIVNNARSLRKQAEALNEQSYEEAKKLIEEIYKQNQSNN